MRTKIVPVNRGSYYALEERNSSEYRTDPNDNELVRTVGRGFVPFLMWQMEVRPTLKGLFMTTNKEIIPTKEELFESYYKFNFDKHDIGPETVFRPSDQEQDAAFRILHAEEERREYETLPDDFKNLYGYLFKEYLVWLESFSITKEATRNKMSCKAKSIFMLMIEENGKGQFKYSKSKVLEFVAQKWVGNNLSVYNEFRKLQSAKLEKIKQDFPKDYESAYGLYTQEYPD